MPFRLRLTLIFLGILLLSALILPLIIPIPELKTVPIQQLADSNATFAKVNGTSLYYTDTGSAPSTLVLLHGFGSSTLTWRKVTDALTNEGRVIAFDRPGFGFTERPIVTGTSNPYTPEAQGALTLGLLDALEVQNAVLVASSEGAAIAVELALEHPERVAGLVLVGPVLEGRAPPALARVFANTPQGARLGPYIMRQFEGEPGLELLRRAYADPERLTETDIADYRRPLRADNWDRALWEVTKASRTFDLTPRLAELTVPTLIVSGAGDGVVPPEVSRDASAQIPNARFVEIPACGHLPQQECPQRFLAAVTPWLNSLQGNPLGN
jgi:pimeloyl-ACP methyl ester carboxylesterase